ncbi:MAG: trimeric intracellular cation channel family protein [Gaiellales bacterium]
MSGVAAFLPNLAKDTPVWLSLVATAVGALEGALMARQHGRRLDIAGVGVLAISLGFGGGLIRDVLIGNTPPEALRHWEYIAVVALAVLVILALGRQIARFTSALFILDALTLGLFAAVGAQYAVTFHLPAITAVFVGSFAAVGGGVAASLLLGETPRLLRPGPPYAIAAVAGAITYVLLDGVSGGLASFACIVVVFAIRVVAERAGLRTSAIRPIE